MTEQVANASSGQGAAGGGLDGSSGDSSGGFLALEQPSTLSKKPKGSKKKAKGKKKAKQDEPEQAAAYISHPHPDFHVIRKELASVSADADVRRRKQTNIPIGLLREWMIGGKNRDGKFRDAIAYKTSHLGHHKVFIVDEAELLDRYGQNALLKTLEEPPDGTFVILVTSREEQLLPTIRSRCQRVAFGPLGEDVVEQWIRGQGKPTGLVESVGESEFVPAPEMSDKKRGWLVQFAGGSIGQAQLAIDFDLFQWAKQVLPGVLQMTQGVYPAELGAVMATLIDEFAVSWVEAHKNASKDAANRMAAGLMWRMITQYARHHIREQAGQCPNDDPTIGDIRLEPWLGVIDAIGAAEATLKSNVNIGLVADQLVSEMFGSLARLKAARV